MGLQKCTIPVIRGGQYLASEASPGSPIAHRTTKLFRSGHCDFPEGYLQGFTAHHELREVTGDTNTTIQAPWLPPGRRQGLLYSSFQRAALL